MAKVHRPKLKWAGISLHLAICIMRARLLCSNGVPQRPGSLHKEVRRGQKLFVFKKIKTTWWFCSIFNCCYFTYEPSPFPLATHLSIPLTSATLYSKPSTTRICQRAAVRVFPLIITKRHVYQPPSSYGGHSSFRSSWRRMEEKTCVLIVWFLSAVVDGTPGFGL